MNRSASFRFGFLHPFGGNLDGDDDDVDDEDDGSMNLKP